MRSVCLAAFSLAMIVGPIHGQAQPREGFWIGFGAGGGWNTSEGLDGNRRGGGAFHFRLGGTPSPNVLIGAEFIGWNRVCRSFVFACKEGGITVGRGNVTLLVLLFPSRTGGFYVKGGIGGSSATVVTNVLGANVSAKKDGFGATVGTGINIRLGSNLYLTPGLDWLFQAFDAGQNLASTNTLFLITLGLTWH